MSCRGIPFLFVVGSESVHNSSDFSSVTLGVSRRPRTMFCLPGINENHPNNNFLSYSKIRFSHFISLIAFHHISSDTARAFLSNPLFRPVKRKRGLAMKIRKAKRRSRASRHMGDLDTLRSCNMRSCNTGETTNSVSIPDFARSFVFSLWFDVW